MSSLVKNYKVTDGGYKNNRHWSICKCECGEILPVKDNALLSGNTKSCGCITSLGENKIITILKENNYAFSHDAILPEFLQETGHRYRFDFILYNDDGTVSAVNKEDKKQVEKVNKVTLIIKEEITPLIKYIKNNIFNNQPIMSQELVINKEDMSIGGTSLALGFLFRSL